MSYRINGHYNKMVHLIDTSIVTYKDHSGIEREPGKPYDLVGFWVSESMVKDYMCEQKEEVQMSIFDY